MKKINIIFFCSLFTYSNTSVYAKEYILKQKKILKSNKNITFLDEEIDRVTTKYVGDKISLFRIFFYKIGLNLDQDLYYKTCYCVLQEQFKKLLNNTQDPRQKRLLVRKYHKEKLKLIGEKNNIFKLIGEKPKFFDEDEQLNYRYGLENEIRNIGFLDSKIEINTSYIGDFAYTNFFVYWGKRYKIKKCKKNEIINNILGDNSKIKLGAFYDKENFIKEKSLIYKVFKNSGYAFFKDEFIHFYIKKNDKENSLDVETKINCKEEIPLKKYTYNSISLHIDGETHKDVRQKKYKNINFINIDGYSIKKLFRNIPIQKGDLYTLDNEDIIRNNFLWSEVFQDIYFTNELDKKNELFTTIHLIPTQKKIQTDINLGLDKKTKSDNDLFNPYIKTKYSYKNLFKSLAVFEAQLSGLLNIGYLNKILLTPEANIDFFLRFPYFCFLGFYWPEKEQKDLKITTKLKLKFKRLFYKSIFSSNTQDKVKLKDYKSSLVYYFLFFKHNIDLHITPLEILKYRNNAKNIFENVILSKVKVGYIYNLDKDKSFIKNMIEFGFTKESDTKKSDSNKINLIHNQYWKNIFEIKKTFDIKKDLEYIHKFSFGFSYLFENSKIKSGYNYFAEGNYLNIGGKTIIRGWCHNTIGLGIHSEHLLKQRGNIMFVLNNELRKKITSIMEIACFLDMGNNFPLSKNKSIDFFKELAVGYGVGVRFNLNVIVMSLDLGFPMYDPISKNFFKNKVNFYFGLSYPF